MLSSNLFVVHCEGEGADKLCEGRVIDVCEIPAGTTRSTLTLMLESHQLTGLAGVTVDALKFLTDDHSRAAVTLNTVESMPYLLYHYEVLPV